MDDEFADSPSFRNPEKVLSEKQEQERLLTLIRTLPISLRQPMILRLEGLSYEEIGEVLGISQSLVGVRVHRATDKLKGDLE